VSEDGVAERLEMLLVMRWLDEGARDRGEVVVSVADAADELGLDTDRAGLLAVMGALGDLEERGTVEVAWPLGPASSHAHVTLADGLRRDARRLFGRTPG
jgi:hypothetical protein